MKSRRRRAAGLVLHNHKLLLIERTKLHDHYFSVPGGEVESGETPEQAAVREIAEETSVTAEVIKLLYEIETKWGHQFFFLCSYVDGEPQLSPDSAESMHNYAGINHYRPQWVAVKKLAKTDMRPVEVKQVFLEDVTSDFSRAARSLDPVLAQKGNLRQLKRLGQHWLFDEAMLKTMVNTAAVTKSDHVLEIGPGLGTLTRYLQQAARGVTAVEADERFVKHLQTHFDNKALRVVHGDIRQFDLRHLPKGYKVVASIPYYLTSAILQLMLESTNPPSRMVLLVQKEVAERIVAPPGRMSVLAFSVQYYATAKLIKIVPKELFTPAPKVDSAILDIQLTARPNFKADPKLLFQMVKAGFGEKRKKLKNALAGGLHRSPEEMSQIISAAGLKPTVRAQELSMDEWKKLYKLLYT